MGRRQVYAEYWTRRRTEFFIYFVIIPQFGYFLENFELIRSGISSLESKKKCFLYKIINPMVCRIIPNPKSIKSLR